MLCEFQLKGIAAMKTSVFLHRALYAPKSSNSTDIHGLFHHLCLQVPELQSNTELTHFMKKAIWFSVFFSLETL